MHKKIVKTLLYVTILIFVILITISAYLLFKSYSNKKVERDNDNKIIPNDDIVDKDNLDNIIDKASTDDESGVLDNETIDNKSDALEDDEQIDNPIPEVITTPITMAFAGDILLDDNWRPMQRYTSVGKGLKGVFSENLIEELNSADITMVNNEFPFSTRGKKIEDKAYTFRAHPDRVSILHEMGADIVSLANNHALDFGKDALLDTFDVLDQANIDYVGAGKDINRAKQAIFYELEDKKIGFLAASRVIYADSWYAKENSPGMIGIYDTTLLLNEITNTKEVCDYVVVYLHWGIESNNYPEEYQREMAKQFIDAGADIIIGAHPHVMQGIEYYKGKPIVYSLGNFWFSSYKRESALLKLTLNPDNSTLLQILPVYTGDCYTYITEDNEQQKNYFDFIEKLSFNISIDAEGNITEKQQQD